MNNEFPFETFLQSIEQTKNNQEKFSLSSVSVDSENLNLAQSADYSKKNFNPLNKAISDFIKQSLDSTNFELFFKSGLSFKAIENGAACFIAATQFIKETVERDYLSLVQLSLKSILGNTFDIHISINTELENHTVEKQSSSYTPPKSAKDITFNLDLNETKNDKTSKIESQYIDQIEKQHQVIIEPFKTF